MNNPSSEELREQRVAVVKRYFEACNEANRAKFAEVLAEDCVHYFPAETGGPYRGADAIVDLWLGCVRDLGSMWTIDRLVSDGENLAIEWTHWKPLRGEFIRGSEWYTFAADGKIKEIWAHYASPRDVDREVNELEGFPYAPLGYPTEPPQLDDDTMRARERGTRPT